MQKFRFVATALLVGACGGSSSTPPDATPPDAAAPMVTLGVTCTDTTDGVYAAVPTTLPPFDATHRGDVFRCARDRWIDAASLDAAARKAGYAGPALTSGATIFRIAYRTERATEGTAVIEGHTAGLLLVPDQPRATGALIVYAHPSVGIAPGCAPSHIDIGANAADGWEPLRAPMLGMVGSGWTVIAPDYAGFSYGEPPGFASSDDEGRSILDATRAATHLLPAAIRPGKVVIVGHSIGGHGALSAHALAASYGHDGELVGVATFAPFWVSALAWGGVLNPALNFNTTTGSYLLEYDLDYLYSHGELLDGPGHGLDLIKPEKQDAVKTLLTTKCLTPVADDMKTLGATPADYFTAAAVDGLGKCGLSNDCTTAPAPIWKPRFMADRPALDRTGPPLVMWFGEKDTTVTPGYARCAVEKIGVDLMNGGTTPITVCDDPDGEHTTVPARQVAWVNDWIAARVNGTTAPTCTAPKEPTAGGASCPPIPPNQ
jgi:pimeloyl-ACP methyl ester carboxylesterase